MAGDRIRLGAYTCRQSSVGHHGSALRTEDTSGTCKRRERQKVHVAIMSNGRIDALWSFGPLYFVTQGMASCSMTGFVWWYHRWQMSGLQQRLLLSSKSRNSSGTRNLCVQTSTVELTNFALNIRCRWSRLLCTYDIAEAHSRQENHISA